MDNYSRGTNDCGGKLYRSFSSFLKIRSYEELKTFYKDNRDFLKKVAFPFIVILAVIFFWIYGSNDSGEVVVNSGDLTAVSSLEADSSSYDEFDQSAENTNRSNGTSTNTHPLQSGNVIYVDICGEVNSPGVYELKDSTRLFQLIEMAGGLTEDADDISINRASVLVDGQKIVIKSTDQAKNESLYQFDYYTPSSETKESKESKININTADTVILQDIPGIGPSKALSIIAYREEHGPFRKIDDLINVSGIGERTFENIKDYITV